MADYVRIANGSTNVEIVTASDLLPRMQDFLRSEKPFRENTPNSLMADTPPQVRNPSLQSAIVELQGELDQFFEFYQQHPGIQIANPFFGMLDFDMQVQLLHKHATHHLRQFSIDA